MATGLNRAEWKAEVNAARSSSVTAVRVRHIRVQTEGLAGLLREQLRDGASFEELAEKASECATRENGGEIGCEHLPRY